MELAVFTVQAEFLKQVLIKPAQSFTGEHRALNVVAVEREKQWDYKEVKLQYLFPDIDTENNAEYKYN